jgi:hypothetical protein
MSNENPLASFPQQRIKPYDGMAITAEVWDTAHDYHRQAQAAHNLYFHGAGILAGLQVVASDPADNIVIILPGMAVDSQGQVIVLKEPVAYDLGEEIEGPLYLLISNRERLLDSKDTESSDHPAYARDEYLIFARSSFPNTPVVELARFTRKTKKSAIQDAVLKGHPQINEIDLRYRRHIEVLPETLLNIGVTYVGEVAHKNHGKGLAKLTHFFRKTMNYQLIVEDDLPFNPNILNYPLLYVVGEGDLKFTAARVKGLKGYVDQGGILLVESCDETADKAFMDLFEKIDLKPEPLVSQHVLFSLPNIFAALPRGYKEQGEMYAVPGLLYSTRQYGRLWNGETAEQVATREEIRSSIEWAENMFTYLLEQ